MVHLRENAVMLLTSVRAAKTLAAVVARKVVGAEWRL